MGEKITALTASETKKIDSIVEASFNEQDAMLTAVERRTYAITGIFEMLGGLTPVEAIYNSPQHPYSKALLSAMPSMDPDRRINSAPLIGDPPNPINPPSGCRFHTRCPHAEPVCVEKEPVLQEGTTSAEHFTACHITATDSGHSGNARVG